MKPNQLSNTAAFIAVKFYGLTKDEPCRSLFDEKTIRFYEQLVRSLPAPLRYYYAGLKRKWLRNFFTFWEELLLPGDLMHIILRKWYFTKWVDELRTNGYEQMLVLGAGFDHLAALNAPMGLESLELDTPKMIALKRNFVNRHNYNHPNLKLREAFFPNNSLAQILKEQSLLKPQKKTIIIAEGFFDYFSETQDAQFLEDINQYFTEKIALLSTLFSLDELPGFRSFVYEKSIKLSGEELKLGYDQTDFSAFLANHHFKTQSLVSRSEMKDEVLIPNGIVDYPILKGFYLLKTEREQ